MLPSLKFGVNPGKGTITKLKGLKDVEIVPAPLIRDKRRARAYIKELDSTWPDFPGIAALAGLSLRSLRITVEAEYMRESDYIDMFLTFYSRGEVHKIERWLRQLELELHVGVPAATGREAMPAFAIEQDDDAIRLPPWSTDEALERVRVEKEERWEIYRLENEQFEDAQARLVRAGHPPVWTLHGMREMAESSKRSVAFQRSMAQKYGWAV